jgi:tripartite-type tricarboxylate transporter receptor subunit TctC
MGETMTSTIKTIATGAVCLLGMLADAQAQNWPSRPIEVIIPFSAGGGVDIIGRSIASAISEQIGQNIVVVNREGAGGTLGFGQLAAAAPDGYTLGFGPTTPISNAPYLVKGVRYNVESFDYICQVFENVFSIAVGPNSKFKTAQDLLAFAKENPGKLTYGHAGVGSIPHLSVENFADALKIKVTHAPFRGDNALLPLLLNGELDFAAPAVSSIQGRDIRPLVVFSDKRHPALPNVPTAGEVGVATSVPPGFNGLYAPKGLPKEVRSALEQACAKATAHDAVKKATANTSQTISYLTGAQFHDRTAADYKFKGELIKRLGLGGQ